VRRRRASLRWLLLAGACALAGCRPGDAAIPHDSGEWGAYDVIRPQGEVQALAFLLSPASGIGAQDRAAAAELARRGVLVALVDTRVYLRRMRGAGAGSATDCLDVPGAFLWTSHALEKEYGLDVYQPPWMIGRGAGGLLAYAALAQSPAHALAGGVGIDIDDRVLPLERPLCELAATPTARGRRLGVYRLEAPWRFAATRRPTPSLHTWRQGIDDRNDERAAIVTSRTRKYPALVAEVLEPLLREQAAAPPAARMPVVEVKPVSAHGVLVVIFSGDAGWRDIDKQVGGYLAAHGFAVLGVDVLSYFWNARTPDEAAGDAVAMLRTYLSLWHQERLALVGYSFGADILPFIYNRLPADLRKQVLLVSLLAPSRAIEFEIHVADWLGGGDGGLPIPPEAMRLPADKLQCIYGEDEAEDSLCTHSSMPPAAVIRRPGEHHFDGDYEALGAIISDAILRRLPHRAQ
jgi:type IV secretory pathway VirJ component